MKKEITKFGAAVSLVAIVVVIVNVVAWAYVSLVGVVDYDSVSFRESLIEGEGGNWYTPSGGLFVDGTCDSAGNCTSSYVLSR